MNTGLMFLPVAVGAFIFSPLSGRLVGGRFGARPSLMIAGALIVAATLMLAQMSDATPPQWQMLVAFAVFGVGTSMVNAPVTTAAVSGMPTDRAGAAAAITSTSRQVGVAIGVAICGPVAGAALGDTNVDFAVSAQPYG